MKHTPTPAKNTQLHHGLSNNLMVGGAAIAAGALATWLIEKDNREKAAGFLEKVIERARQSSEDGHLLATEAIHSIETNLDNMELGADLVETAEKVTRKADDLTKEAMKG